MAARKGNTDCTGQSCAALAQAVDAATAGHFIPIDAAAYCGQVSDRYLPCGHCWEAWGKAFPSFVQAVDIVSGRHPKQEKKTQNGDFIDLCQRCFTMFRLVKPNKKTRTMPCPRCMPSTTEPCGGCGRPVFNPEDFSLPRHLHHLLRCCGCNPGCMYCGNSHTDESMCELAKVDIGTRGGIPAGKILTKDFDFNLTSHARSGDLNPAKVTKVKPREPFHVFLHRSFVTEASKAWSERTIGSLTDLFKELAEGIILFGPIGMFFTGNKVNWLTLMRGSLPRERANMMETWRRLDNVMTDVISYPPKSIQSTAWRATISNFSPAACAPFIYIGVDTPTGKHRHSLVDVLVNQLTRHTLGEPQNEQRNERIMDPTRAPEGQQEARMRALMEQARATGDQNAEGFPWRLFEPRAAPRADRARAQEAGRFRVDGGVREDRGGANVAPGREVMERGIDHHFITQRLEEAPPPDEQEREENAERDNENPVEGGDR